MHLLSKLAWLLLKPDNFLVLILTLGLALLWLPWRRGRQLGRGLASIALGAFLAITFLHLGVYAETPLENRFPPPAPMPDRVDGIIVLDVAYGPEVNTERSPNVVGELAPRLTAALALAKRYPEAPILLTGGIRASGESKPAEAADGGAILVHLGLAPERLLQENRSLNTYESVLYSKALAAPRPGQVWLLVTSAVHMPRAIAAFRAQGWPVLAYPVAYQSEGRYVTDPNAGLGDELQLLDLAAREWIGLFAYRVLGRTESFFPAP